MADNADVVGSLSSSIIQGGNNNTINNNNKLCAAQQYYNKRGYCNKALYAMCVGLKTRATGNAALIDLNRKPWTELKKKDINATKSDLLAEIKRRCLGEQVPKTTNWTVPKCMEWLEDNPITNENDITFLRTQIRHLKNTALALADEHPLLASTTVPRLHPSVAAPDANSAPSVLKRTVPRDHRRPAAAARSRNHANRAFADALDRLSRNLMEQQRSRRIFWAKQRAEQERFNKRSAIRARLWSLEDRVRKYRREQFHETDERIKEYDTKELARLAREIDHCHKELRNMERVSNNTDVTKQRQQRP
jgi:hypothetical protein